MKKKKILFILIKIDKGKGGSRNVDEKIPWCEYYLLRPMRIRGEGKKLIHKFG